MILRAQGTVVQVKWVDAIIRAEVEEGDDLSPPTAITYGVVVDHNEDFISVAHEHFIDTEVEGQYRGVTTIPVGMVAQITNLWAPR